MKLSEAVSFPSANKEIIRQDLTQGDITPRSDFNLEENGILNLKYYAGSLKTTWEDIENVCTVKDIPKRAKLIESILGKNVSCNTKTAVSIFSKLVNDGAIRRGGNA